VYSEEEGFLLGFGCRGGVASPYSAAAATAANAIRLFSAGQYTDQFAKEKFPFSIKYPAKRNFLYARVPVFESVL
jgi:hypothetical protein